MAIRNPPLFLGKAGILHPAQNDRLGLLGAMLSPAPLASGALAAASGALIGPAGSMGELTLVSPTVLRIGPGRWEVQGLQNTLQGVYTVTNDANLDRTITARHASQYRRSVVVAYAADSSVTGGGADTSDVVIVDGALSAVAPGALPDATAITAATSANYVVLGEIAIPPTTTGAVTLTAYNPRTGVRGGILPVIDSATNRPGHAGAPPVFDGQYRDHPTRGLERGKGGAWTDPLARPRAVVTRTSNYDAAGTVNNIVPWAAATTRSTPGMWSAGAPTRVTIPETGEYDVTTFVPWSSNAAQGGRTHGVRRNGVVGDTPFLAGTNQGAAAWYGSEQAGNYPGWELTAGDYLELVVIQNAVSLLPILLGVRMAVELVRR